MSEFDRAIKLTPYPGGGQYREVKVNGYPDEDGDGGAVHVWLTEGHMHASTFMTPREARRLAEALLDAAWAATGLTVPK